MACSRNLANFANCQKREREGGGKGINLEKKMKYLESGHDSSGRGRHNASAVALSVNVMEIFCIGQFNLYYLCKEQLKNL